jgi:carboxylate-amine ligase
MLFRLRTSNQRWRTYAHMLVSENVWRAQRYGSAGDLMDFGRSKLVPFDELIDELVELVRPDAEELGCVDEVEHARVIAREGTSAARQLAVYQQSINEGNSTHEALRDVVDSLIAETLEDT